MVSMSSRSTGSRRGSEAAARFGIDKAAGGPQNPGIVSGFVPISSLRRPVPPAPWWIRRSERLLLPPDRVWRALTDAGELAAWWCDEARIELRPGGTYAFGGRHVLGSSGGPAVEDDRFTVLEVEPPERLVFRWPLLGVDTTVTYELENHLEMTELTVTQEADRAVGWPCGSELPTWWAPALSALRTHLEKGRPDLRLDHQKIELPGPIRFEVGITTFPWLIWDKLTESSELRRWWAREAESEPREGGVLRLGSRRFGPSRYLLVEPETRLIHDWIWDAAAPAAIEWRLEENEHEVRVSVTDPGPWPLELPRFAVAIQWASTLLALEEMSERGTSALEREEKGAT